MNAVNMLILALIASLAATVFMVLLSDQYLQIMSDHGLFFIFAIGFIGLVGAREKTPETEA
ncbi:hypothetical protein [Ketobacter alkanivorans]|uniref:Uncharacterized protein n=1 Tax=Ketobacter alkanivorans TaxID=1917421 RepID=A0A2K9LQF2_9GAMM|nr:hypothetical protein [Ketobacter alkanivorans]AUM14558.1 hypothetical protein Kalk_19925 [Ketobacter alkanivorans]MCP5013975.1 hypothetical protein [Ketobacter sp.]